MISLTCIIRACATCALFVCLFVPLNLVSAQVDSAREKEEKRGTRNLWCTYETGQIEGAASANGRHIVLVSGDDEYRSEEALPMLGKILSQRFGFKCSVLFAINPDTGHIQPDLQTNIPGLHLLEDCDLVILGLRFRGLPDAQMKYIDQYLAEGKPVIAVRTSTHAFRFTKDMETSYRRYDFRGNQTWPGGFGKQVLGETWVSHHGQHGQQSTRGIIAKGMESHPILAGVNDVWGPTDVYGIRKLPDGCKVLLHGQVLSGMSPEDKAVQSEINDPMMPVAWIREWVNDQQKTCSIFCTTLGSSTDFECDDLRRLIVNASLQMTGMGDQIKQDSNVEYVDDYDPTNFGFGNYKKGLGPADYALGK